MEHNEYLQVRTKGNAAPQGKPKVYFSCHPEDFGRSFDTLCADIFASHDCAIYYTKDMAAAITDENRDLDLSRMNLFVIPVSFRLLNTPNRAMDVDFPFAVAHHIPVFPILLESGLDALYSRKDKFGSLQYLDPLSRDTTAIRYVDKLKKNLDSVLVDDETAKQVRAAFDAYIFLSYRKKDRRYANQLMRIIHSDPLCRDIAIWYDEFLAPGENFNDVIGKALQKSDLFALLVTPNLVNEDNYVRRVEYPEAQTAKKPTLPAEMVPTDPAALREQYPDIPESVDPREESSFRERLLAPLRGLALRKNDSDPKHTFLIGLAYLDGIDVEKDLPRALALITSAADADLPEAMLKLRNMYRDGDGVERDLRKTLYWNQRFANDCIRKYGMEDPTTLRALNNLACCHLDLGDYQNTAMLLEKIYPLCREILGEKDPRTLSALNNFALACSCLGDYARALTLQQNVLTLCRETLGGEHPDTLSSMSNLALIHSKLGDFQAALELQEKGYALSCQVLGEEHPNTLSSLSNLALTYSNLGHQELALSHSKRAYARSCKALGEEHPATLKILTTLASIYFSSLQPEPALYHSERAYILCRKVLGEEHPDTITALSNLAQMHRSMGEHETALEEQEKAYELSCKLQGRKHPDTLTMLDNLAHIYSDLDERCIALGLFEQVYALRREILGASHPDTRDTLTHMEICRRILHETVKRLEATYAVQCRTLGKNHTDTLSTLYKLAVSYEDLDDYREKTEIFQTAYKLSCDAFGPTAKEAMNMLSNLAMANAAQGDMEEALRICDFILQVGRELTANTLRKLISLYEQNGQTGKAAALRARLNG